MRPTITGAALVASLLCASQAMSLDLRWSTGNLDLEYSSAVRCTLVVTATGPDEALPSEWHLVWVAEAVDLKPLSFPLTSEAANGVAEVCAAPTAITVSDLVTNTQTIEFCSGPAGRVRVAHMPIELKDPIRARFRIMSAGSLEGSSAEGHSATPAEVTLNGGVSLSYPPSLVVVQHIRADDSLVVVATGRDLEGVVHAAYVSSSEARRVPLRILSKSASSLVLDANVAYQLGPGHVEIADPEGRVARIAFSGEPLASRPAYSRDRFIIRFRSKQVAAPNTAASTPLDAVAFASPSTERTLRELGVVSLQRVFPWFRDSDVTTTNLIGERVALENLADFYFARVADGEEVGAVVRSARNDPAVLETVAEYGGPAWLAPPNDPLYPKQWGFENTGQTICQIPGSFDNDINAESAWTKTIGSPSVMLAILDTGIDTTHTELLNRARLGPPFVQPTVATSFDDAVNPNGPLKHGTAVTGLAAAAGNNGVAMAGVAWTVVPWGVKVLNGSDGFSRASWVGQGIAWATANRIPIINMSLGFPAVPCPGADGSPIPTDSANIMKLPLLNALYTGQIAIASTGNCNSATVFWPASFANRVYSVGAHLQTGERWEDADIWTSGSCVLIPPNCPGSTYGPWIDAVAPGGRFVVTLDTGPSGVKDIGPTCNRNNPATGWAFGGTSAAAGVASGIAALLKSREPALLGEDIANLLNVTAAHPGNPSLRDDFVGYGRLRASAALSQFDGGRILLQPAIGAGGQWPLVEQESLQVTQAFHNVPSLFGNRVYTAWRHRLIGTATFTVPFSTQPWLWTRSSGTWGWRDTTAGDSIIDYNEEVRSGRIIGSISTTANTFETSVYRVVNPDNPSQGVWFPCPPTEALVAFTAIGLPTTILDIADPDPKRLFSVWTHPNPAQRTISIDLTLPRPGVVRVSVLDVLGRQVAQLGNGDFTVGDHRIRWNGTDSDGERLAAGVYFARVFFDGRTVVRRFVLLGTHR